MRIEALRCHGFIAEARRLAVAVARGIKYHQLKRIYHGRASFSAYLNALSSHRGKLYLASIR